MRNYRLRSVFQALMWLALGVGLLHVFASASLAQTGALNPPPSSDPSVQMKINRLDMSEREFAMRNNRMSGNRLVAQAQRKLMYSQIKEDFERLQELNNNLMGLIGSTLDAGRVSELTLEVKKRANRLKLNLGLPDPEDDGKGEKRQPGYELNQRLDKSIVMLDHAINSFVTSPLFRQSPDVIDAQHVNRAAGDLNHIIEISDAIRKNVEQLGKSAK